MKIYTADWILPVSSEPIERGGVAIDGVRIVGVGKFEEIVADFPEAVVEDYGTAAIMPGFVNCHSHLELTVMRGFLDDIEHDFFQWLLRIAKTRANVLSDADIMTSALLGAVEGIQAGVTCFGDIGRFGRAGFDALRKTGLRGIVFQETEFSPNDDTAAEDFSRLHEKYAGLKAEESEIVLAGISPHSPYTVSRRLFELITELAVRENIPLSIHASESKVEEELMLSGNGAMADFFARQGINWTAPNLSSIGYLSSIGVLQAKPLLAHCITISQSDLEMIRESDSGIAHCPKSNAKFGHSVAPFEDFLDRGMRVGFGSDSVASNNTCDLLEEARFAALTARSRETKKRLITAKEIIETMTLGGARAMRLESAIGTLETGKQADLVVLSLDHYAQQPIHDINAAVLFATSARDVVLTVVAGNEVYRDGRVSGIDHSELKADVRRIAAKMSAAPAV